MPLSPAQFGHILQQVTATPLSLGMLGHFKPVTQTLQVAAQRAGLPPTLTEHLGSPDYDARLKALHTLAKTSAFHRSLAPQLSATNIEMLEEAHARFKTLASTPSKAIHRYLFLGDIHGDWEQVRKIIGHECQDGNATVISAGDLESYPTIPDAPPILFVPGNHEDHDALQGLPPFPAPGTPRPLRSGEWMLLQGGLRLAGLSGVFSSRYSPQNVVRHFPYFNRHDVERVANINVPVSFFLSHEPPHGVGMVKRGKDVGIRFVSRLIQELSPRVAFFGHHHLDFTGMLGKTTLIGLNRPSKSYVIASFDMASEILTLERIRTRRVSVDGTMQWAYPWERSDAPATDDASEFLGKITMTAFTPHQDMQQWIESQYRADLLEQLSQRFLSRMEGATEEERQLKARSLAGMLINTAMPYAAEFVAVCRSPASQTERDLLRKRILERLQNEQPAYAHQDLLLVFEEIVQRAAANPD